jgi:hypothetical protein
LVGGVSFLTGFSGRDGFGMCCWAICFPMTTKALPTSSLVLCIVASHNALDSIIRLETAMWAFEMSVASLRPWPTWPMRWLAT